MISVRRIFLLLVLVSPCRAAFQHDFGQGLAYVRIADLTKDSEDLQAALMKDSVILDLRNAVGTAEAAAAFGQRLDRALPGKQGLRIILINPSAAPEIITAASRPQPRQLTVGPRLPTFKSDITVAVTAEDDQRAYGALAAGVPIDKLITSNSEKRRFDEAALARTRGSSSSPSADEDDDENAPSPRLKPIDSTKANTPAQPAVQDLVLSRAIQIYRALLVFKQ